MIDLFGGADRDRTDDLLNAIQALSQLSYGPTRRIQGGKFCSELPWYLRNIDKGFAKVKSAIHKFSNPYMIFHRPSMIWFSPLPRSILRRAAGFFR